MNKAENQGGAGELAFDRSSAPAGEAQQLSALVRRLIAPNAGPFTFTGTCTYIVGRGQVAVIDPGPEDAGHAARILEATRGEQIVFVIATHTHRDHSPAAAALAATTGAALVGCAAFDPASGPEIARSQDLSWRPGRILSDGERIRAKGFELVALATPGHASNHLCFALPEEKALFSGDHVMAWSTTVVAPPDGDMSAYMRSLERLRLRDDAVYWPGHGGPVRDPQRFVRALASHRRHRELLILNRLRAGDRSVASIVENTYNGLDPRLRSAAARSVFAHLIDLADRGLARCEGPLDIAADFAPALGARSPLEPGP